MSSQLHLSFATVLSESRSKIGNSLFDQPGSEKVAALVEKAKKNNVKVVFPVDYITADKFDKDAKVCGCSLTFRPTLTVVSNRLALRQMLRAFPMAGWALTLDRRVEHSFALRCSKPKQFCGMGAFDTSFSRIIKLSYLQTPGCLRVPQIRSRFYCATRCQHRGC